MAGFVIAAATIVSAATIYSAKTQAAAAKKAAQKQATAIKEQEEAAAARQVFGDAAESNINESADILIGDEDSRNPRKRKSRIDLQKSTTSTSSTGIGGL